MPGINQVRILWKMAFHLVTGPFMPLIYNPKKIYGTNSCSFSQKGTLSHLFHMQCWDWNCFLMTLSCVWLLFLLYGVFCASTWVHARKKKRADFFWKNISFILPTMKIKKSQPVRACIESQIIVIDIFISEKQAKCFCFKRKTWHYLSARN